MKIKFAWPNTREWEDAVRLAKEKYVQSFNAKTSPNPTCFVVGILPDESGTETVAACAGLTFADSRQLFSEQYLPLPIEQHIQQAENQSVERHAIVEVGSLASVYPQAGSELARLMPLICWCIGMRYFICTSTVQLRKLLTKLNIAFKPLLVVEQQNLSEIW